jgi:hypothetical protein
MPVTPVTHSRRITIQGQDGQKPETLFEKNPKAKMAGGRTQVVEHSCALQNRHQNR